MAVARGELRPAPKEPRPAPEELRLARKGLRRPLEEPRLAPDGHESPRARWSGAEPEPGTRTRSGPRVAAATTAATTATATATATVTATLAGPAPARSSNIQPPPSRTPRPAPLPRRTPCPTRPIPDGLSDHLRPGRPIRPPHAGHHPGEGRLFPSGADLPYTRVITRTPEAGPAVDLGVSTASVLPILTDPTDPNTGVAVTGAVAGCAREPGAGAPGDIIIRSCTTIGQALRIELQGEIDHHSTLPLRALLASAAALGYVHLSVDTRHVTFADSALLNALDCWSRRERRLRLGPRSPGVQRLLDAARPVGGTGVSSSVPCRSRSPRARRGRGSPPGAHSRG
ncbi:STAS domain-containing protein [Streptomyces sp. NPDC007084]|uniref:STAS domain-containing protein n=1 Tax=Streptomyces sp. NPDC007084 TaxID=3154313 RepID=UPI0034512DA9